MQEYWVNVSQHKNGAIDYQYHENKEVLISWHSDVMFGKVLYRVHVKIKPVYIQVVGRHKRAINLMDGFNVDNHPCN